MIKAKKVYKKLIPEEIRTPFRLWRHKIIVTIKTTPLRLLDHNIRNMKPRLQELKGEYNGNRCIIMGNGPSLNQMDLSLFANEYVWASNRAYLIFDRIQWRPKFYVAVDTRVVPDNADEINSLSYKLPDSLFFYPADFRYNRILESENNVYWYNEIPINEENLPYSMFSINPSEFVYSVRSVTIAMMQLAVYMGFNPIYLIGCDTSYIVPKTVKYEDGNSYLLISTDSDPNHFDSSYFGKGKKWHEPNADLMIFHYEQARKVCDELGVEVFNATVGGNLEVFPRINYLELLS